MITRLTQGLNASIFGSFVLMASTFAPVPPALSPEVSQPAIATRTVATQQVSPVRTISEPASPVQTVSERRSPVQTVTEVPAAVVAPTKSSAAPSIPQAALPIPSLAQAPVSGSTTTPRQFSPSSPLIPLAGNGARYLPVAQAPAATRSADPIVPPIARRRPTDGATIAAERKLKPKADKTTVAAKADKQDKAKLKNSTTIASAPKPEIDLSGRSALGAPLPSVIKCTSEQRYDSQARTCVSVVGTTPVKAKAARAPTAQPAQR